MLGAARCTMAAVNKSDKLLTIMQLPVRLGEFDGKHD